MELLETKELLQTVFDSASNGIAVMQPVYNQQNHVDDFSVLLFNTHMLNWLGHVDYKGKRYSEIFPLTYQTGILEKFIRVTETGVRANFEHRHDLENVESWFCIDAIKQGELLIVTVEDITNRKRTEIALKEALDAIQKQQRIYDSITSTTPDLVYVFDLNYRFTYANKALLTMWGKTWDNSIGKGLRENGYEEWHAQMHEREIDEVVATKKSIRGTVSFPHAELGRRIYDYIFAPVINEKGEVEAIAGTTRDITDIKNAEEQLQQSGTRLKSMIHQTPAPTLVLMGDDLVIEQINQSMLQMIGRGEEIIGVPLIKILPELEGQYIWEQVQKVYREGVPFDQWEVPVSHARTGVIQDYYYNIAYRPLIENGRITGMIQVAIDITESFKARKAAEESENRYKTLSETLEQQVNHRTKELQRSNDDLQQFAHVASHDLKEPVRKIETFIHRLEEHLKDRLDSSSLRFIDRIHVATKRMFTMIDGVLVYSTINAGKQKSEQVDLNEVIKNIETDLEVSLQKTGGMIHYQNLPSLEGAQVLLYQLFYNLINNSIKFAQAGVPPIIEISSETVVEHGEALARITVQDNGIGFEHDYTTQIFETFTRLNSKDQYEGTGLGLSLCKKIAERHGGYIMANGMLNKGATFIVTLPMQQKNSGII